MYLIQVHYISLKYIFKILQIIMYNDTIYSKIIKSFTPTCIIYLDLFHLLLIDKTNIIISVYHEL